jgi:hypothetical protein
MSRLSRWLRGAISLRVKITAAFVLIVGGGPAVSTRPSLAGREPYSSLYSLSFS